MSFLFNVLPESFEERLETEHLLLRPYQEGDESDFMRLILENTTIMDPAFEGRLARVRALEDARMQVQQLRTAWDNRRYFDFGVWLKESNTYVGNIALQNLEYKIPKAEMGLYFTAWPETKELVQEALQEVLYFAFDTLGMNKVYIRFTATNNFYSELVLECGFKKEGILRSDFRGTDSAELLDITYFGITRPDFEAQRQQAAQHNTTALV